jgi:hypothetical protein
MELWHVTTVVRESMATVYSREGLAMLIIFMEGVLFLRRLEPVDMVKVYRI